MVKLYRCKICGDPYIGTDAPKRCPHCGAYENFMVDAKDFKETFDVELNEKDKANVEKALQVEIGNAEFYFCAAAKAKDEETKNLFKALAKVEAEHASIWKKILKLDKADISKASDECSTEDDKNFQESHDREDHAIKFYAEAAGEAENERIRQIFRALVQVETDHLQFSEERLKLIN